jgi:hypothetical protein
MHNAVRDYAATLTRRLASDYGWESLVIAATVPGLPADSEAEIRAQGCESIILHYVNYGYHPRGIPFWLDASLRTLREVCSGKLLVIFHELYASGPPWKSAFWLQPLQVQIARRLARMADASLVSSETLREQLLRLKPRGPVATQPVVSNFGEPTLSADQLEARDPHRWIICGGSHLIARSLPSLLQRIAVIPVRCKPRELLVVGGSDNADTRKLLASCSGIECRYHPETSAAEASALLASAAWGFMDYFHRAEVPTDAILKSTSFAAYCAHGVIPVFPQAGSRISASRGFLPGPYFVSTDNFDLPDEPGAVAWEIYQWYSETASSQHLARSVASALGITAGPKPSGP